MDAENIFECYARQAGWSQHSRESILLRYIENQNDAAGFADFLAQQVEEEEELAQEVEIK